MKIPIPFAVIPLILFSVTKLASCDVMPYISHHEHRRYTAFIEEKIAEAYPSDDADKGEVLTQEADDNLNLIYYKLKDKPVFVSVGKKNMEKSVVVLLRGEDYLDPMNKNRLVVLRKRGSGNEYNIHVAVIWRDVVGDLRILWQNAVINMLPRLGGVLKYILDKFHLVEPYRKGGIRPNCGWFGFVLNCESTEEVLGTGELGAISSKPRPIGRKKPSGTGEGGHEARPRPKPRPRPNPKPAPKPHPKPAPKPHPTPKPHPKPTHKPTGSGTGTDGKTGGDEGSSTGSKDEGGSDTSSGGEGEPTTEGDESGTGDKEKSVSGETEKTASGESKTSGSGEKEDGGGGESGSEGTDKNEHPGEMSPTGSFEKVDSSEGDSDKKVHEVGGNGIEEHKPGEPDASSEEERFVVHKGADSKGTIVKQPKNKG